MNIIEKLKENKDAFGLMEPELRRVAGKIGRENFSVRFGGQWDVCLKRPWNACDDDAKTYRLHADFVCQHPETESTVFGAITRCPWCGFEIVPEKRCGWVEVRVAVRFWREK